MAFDPYFYSNTKLLIPCDDVLYNYLPRDVSISRRFCALVNGYRTNSQVKFGTHSIYNGGTNYYFYLPDSEAYIFGTADFTIEFWLKTAAGTNKVLVDRQGSSTTNWLLWINGSGKLEWYRNSTSFKQGSLTNFSNNVWRHIAVVRNSGVLHFYVDGVEDGTGTLDTSNYSTAVSYLAFGGQVNSRNNSYDITGYFDDIRITNGLARYTSNFTAPTEAHPKGVIHNYLASIGTLISFYKGENSSGNLTDELGSYNLTPNGAPLYQQTKIIDASEYSTYLEGANFEGAFASLNGNTKLSVVCCVSTTGGEYQSLVKKSGVFELFINEDNTISFTVNDYTITSTTTILDTPMFLVGVYNTVYSKGTMSLWMNGEIIAQGVSSATSITDNNSQNLFVGDGLSGYFSNVGIFSTALLKSKIELANIYAFELIPQNTTLIDQQFDFAFNPGNQTTVTFNNLTDTVTTITDVYYKGSYKIEGYVTLTGNPIGRRVYLFDAKSKLLVKKTFSDPITGFYSFNQLSNLYTYYIVSEDHTNVKNPLIQTAVLTYDTLNAIF